MGCVLLIGALAASGCQQQAPAPPRRGEVVPPGQVTITWDPVTRRTNGAPLSDLAGYVIQVGSNPDAFERVIRVGPWPRYTVRGLKPGRQYFIRIAAYDRHGHQSAWSKVLSVMAPLPQKINFVPSGGGRTPNPAGWIAYDGAPYHPDRGFGWLSDLRGQARDRGPDAPITLADGQVTTPAKLGRPELANMHSLHGENRLRVFRLDLPNGWYRVTCSSVDPGGPLPLVDQRSFKCRSGDVVFAGPQYGPPLTVKGSELVEGSGIVEVTHGHLRIVVGDPAYGGWTWRYQGPWYSGWLQWLKKGHHYANGWIQRLTRTVDPGFHSLRINALQIESVAPPIAQGRMLLVEKFQRDDSRDINAGLAADDRWTIVENPDGKGQLAVDIAHAALRVRAQGQEKGQVTMVRSLPAPPTGTIEVSMRVSLFAGAGSRKPAGSQETGLMLLSSEEGRFENVGTVLSLGYAADKTGPRHSRGSVRMNIMKDDGASVHMNIEDRQLPFFIQEGEYRLALAYRASDGLLQSININDHELLPYLPSSPVHLLPPRAVGIRAVIDATEDDARLHQYYWAIEAQEF